MNQYCRYCAEAVGQDEVCIYCEVKDRFFSKTQCSRPNKCKSFRFNEIDALGFDLSKKYKPRETKEKKADKGILELFSGVESC